MTVARVLALKDDLDALQVDLYKDDKALEQERKRVMGSICNLIARDFDFTQPRQVTFDIAALQNWREYQEGLIATLSADGTGQTLTILLSTSTCKQSEISKGRKQEYSRTLM